MGDFLTMHPGIGYISFTGGDTSIAISKKAGMIPLQMELGGKDACIILYDVDLDVAAANVVKGGFSYCGQRCTAVKVVLVMESVADTIVEKVNAKVANMTVVFITTIFWYYITWKELTSFPALKTYPGSLQMQYLDIKLSSSLIS